MTSSKRTDTAVVKVGGDAPSFLQEFVGDADKSLAGMKEYRVLPRAKLIQGMTDATLKEEFGEGAVIMSPGRALVAGARTPFLFAPLFFFTEFCKWRDRRDKSGSVIVARSADKAGEVAARARNAEQRFEEYAGGPAKEPFKYRYVEHLNFAGLVYDPDHFQNASPITVGFSRGEFFTGKNFVSAIMLRKVGGIPAPLWSQVWQLQSNTRTRADNTWWGIDFQNPERPWITEEQAPFMRGMHEELRNLYAQERLTVDASEADDDESATVDLNAEMGG